MISLAVTGGIGSGKSYVCRLLEERGIPVFYIDDEAKIEMRKNPDIHAELRRLIGHDVIDNQGKIVKARIADFICQGEANAAAVNKIVHPRVRERMHRWLEQGGRNASHCQKDKDLHAQSPIDTAQSPIDTKDENHSMRIVAVECALLFEAGWEKDVDKVATVSAPENVRVRRIMQRDNISESKALEWIHLQMPQEEKERRSQFVILNDGRADLSSQIDEMIDCLRH